MSLSRQETEHVQRAQEKGGGAQGQGSHESGYEKGG